jgi:hypothetical protein
MFRLIRVTNYISIFLTAVKQTFLMLEALPIFPVADCHGLVPRIST